MHLSTDFDFDYTGIIVFNGIVTSLLAVPPYNLLHQCNKTGLKSVFLSLCFFT